MPKAPHILICDDQTAIHETLSLYLEAEGFTHSSAYDGEQALSMIQSEQPDLVTFLRREKLGGLTLEGLQPGQWRELTEHELKELCAQARGMGPKRENDQTKTGK